MMSLLGRNVVLLAAKLSRSMDHQFYIEGGEEPDHFIFTIVQNLKTFCSDSL